MIVELDRTPLEKIRVLWTEYKGSKFIDLRLYVMDSKGEWIPTKKGITFSKEQMGSFIDLLGQSKDRLLQGR